MSKTSMFDVRRSMFDVQPRAAAVEFWERIRTTTAPAAGRTSNIEL